MCLLNLEKKMVPVQSFDKERRGHFRLDNYMSLCIFLKSAR